MVSEGSPHVAPRDHGAPFAGLKLRWAAGGSADPPALDDAQRRVVDHQGGPLLVLAGPGTGKTTTIVESVAARLTAPEALHPSEVLVVTFGRDAASELRARLAGRLDAGGSVQVATFHSLAWALLQEQPDEDLIPQALLPGPEQDRMVRELLADPADRWLRLWPADQREALEAPALAGELIAWMASARAHGWEPDQLLESAASGSLATPQMWPAAAAFFEHYLQMLDLRGVVDYAEAIHRATLLVQQTPALRQRFRAIYVDEFQDTDPAQVALIAALSGPQTTLVAVGDPDQAIYRFRGADVRGINQFTSRFRTAQGAEAPVVVLEEGRRFGAAIRDAAANLIEPVSLSGLPGAVARTHRHPRTAGPAGQVSALISRTPEEQGRDIADLLRRARFESEDALRWGQMAVLVRSAVEDVPRLQRAMAQADIPVEVAAGDLPLGSDPSVAPLLTGLRLVSEPERVDGAIVRSYLLSPLVGLSAMEVRGLQRKLREAELVQARDESRAPRGSDELLAAALRAAIRGEVAPSTGEQPFATDLAEVASVLSRAAAPGLSVAERLWRLWCDGGDHEGRWAQDLHARALAGGSSGRRADIVLDSVLELFRVAERFPRGAGTGLFLDALDGQQIPWAIPERPGWSRDAVRLLTAHRAKGLQWPLVVVVGMQQDQWPDVRTPGSYLRADLIGHHGVDQGLTRRELLDDERRLAYVAVTRAQQRLVISAVRDDDEAAPSEFFSQATAGIPAEDVRASSAGPRDYLTGASLVASLREVLSDSRHSERLRDAAAARLAVLADRQSGSALAPQADPRSWWGLEPPTSDGPPMVPPGSPVALSATAAEGIAECPLRWFLQRRMHADGARGAAVSIGSLVHAVIEAVISGRLEAELDAMMQALEPVWKALPLDTGWLAQTRWEDTRAQLARFLHWWHDQPRVAAGVEQAFDLQIDGAEWPIRLRGVIDLVEIDSDGRVTVVDFKTSRSPVTASQAEESLQLGVYQWAVPQLALDELPGRHDSGASTVELPLESDGTATDCAGAALVYLAKGAGKGGQQPTVRTQEPLKDPHWVVDTLVAAAQVIREERIEAQANESCTRCVFKPQCPLWGGSVV